MQDPLSGLDVRQRIMREATRLFAEQGFGSTSVRELVEAAGVTKPTLYYYFENKEALLHEIVEEQLDGLAAFMRQVVTSQGSVKARLTHFARAYIEGGLREPHVVRLLMTLSHKGKDTPDIDIMTMHISKIEGLGELIREGMASGELRKDLDVQAAVMSFIGTTNLYLAACLEHIRPSGDPAEGIIDLFFNGVAAR